jgi:hypothetical protein
VPHRSVRRALGLQASPPRGFPHCRIGLYALSNSPATSWASDPHLLQIALVLVNTLMIQRVLGEERWVSALGADDLRVLTPLIYSHVNPYGVFDLDLSTRLPIDATA